jgi:putative flippase GtrA
MTDARRPNSAGTDFKTHGARFALFSGVGVFNTVTDFAVFTALTAVDLVPLAANAVGFLAANGQSYLINARLTFRENGEAARMSPSGFLKFAGAHVLSLLLSSVSILLLSELMGAFAAKAAAAFVSVLWNYATSALIAFAPHRPTESRAR